jgi:hypothetical protein
VNVSCTVEGCERPVLCRELCSACYARLRRQGTLKTLGKVTAMTCTVDDCGGRNYSHGLCSHHYQTARKVGDPAAGTPTPCAATSCTKYALYNGYCRPHYYRVRTYGDPLGGGPLRVLTAPPGSDACSYTAAHTRVRKQRGSASAYPCAAEGCDKQAQQWAYRHDCPREQTGYIRHPRGVDMLVAWSPDPEAYEPLCCSHHVTADKARVRERQAAA